MNLKERFMFVLGLLFSLFGFLIGGLFLIGVSMTDYSLPEESLKTDITIGIVLGFIPLLVGIFICKKANNKGKKRQEDLLENEILKLVATLKGKITTAELAANTKLSIKEAESKLEYYVKSGFVERHISEGGVFVYSFLHIISEEEKRRAKNLNEF
jgi:membrane protein implicated in regulation of membrane protease activity